MTAPKTPSSKPDACPLPGPETKTHQSDLLDEALEESFPASDPVSIPSRRDMRRECQAAQPDAGQADVSPKPGKQD